MGRRVAWRLWQHGGGGAAWGGGKQGVLCDSWAHNVGIVPSQSCLCSPKGGGQRTELGASARALGESLCATQLGEREILNAHVAAHPQANLTKVRDAAEKNQCQLPLPQPSPHPSPFDSFSYFSHFISCCALPVTVILFFFTSHYLSISFVHFKISLSTFLLTYYAHYVDF